MVRTVLTHVTLFVFFVASLLSVSNANNVPSDPYVIIDKHIVAIGGWDAVNAIASMHAKGTVDFASAGLSGTLESWFKSPVKSRDDVDFNVFKQTTSTNGSVLWQMDQNSKVQIITDSDAVIDKQLELLISRSEHLRRGSTIFTVTFDRMESVETSPCYVLKFANSLNSALMYGFFDTATYLPLKVVKVSHSREEHTLLEDYRSVSGILLPFSFEVWEANVSNRMKIKISDIEVNSPVDDAIFDPPVSDVKDYRFPQGASFVEMPFQFQELHIFVNVTVNGKTRPWFLDSGAEVSVVESDFARDIGLQLEGRLTGQGAVATVDVSFTTLPPFVVGDIQFDSQKVAAIEINNLFEPLLGLKVGGILGYDFLSRFVTKIDYANSIVTFYDPESFTYTGAGVVLSAPVTKEHDQYLVCTIDSTYTGKWSVDLGAGGESFLFPYAESNGFLARNGVSKMSFGAGGGQLSSVSRFKTLDVGGFTVTNPLISIPFSKGKGSFSASNYAGNAGNNLLRRFVVYLDYKRESIILEKGEHFDSTFATDNSGLQLKVSGPDELTVVHIAGGTPAEVAGVFKNDKILSVNGKSISDIGGLLGVNELLKSPAGTSLELAIYRNGRSVSKTIVLKNLYE